MPTPLTPEAGTIVEPSKWGARFCRLFGHLWQDFPTDQQILDHFHGRPGMSLCTLCRRWISFSDKRGGSVPPHDGIARLLLSLRSFLDRTL